MLGCGEIILIEINSLFLPLKILFIAQVISKIWLTAWLYNLGKEDGGGNTVVKMEKVFKPILYYNELFTLMIHSFTATCWGECRTQEPLAGLTNHQPSGPQASAGDHQGRKTGREGLRNDCQLSCPCWKTKHEILSTYTFSRVQAKRNTK